MSVLLRHPALVPSLFSRAVEPDPPPCRGPAWCWIASAPPLRTATAWVTVVLIEVPLVKAGLAVLGLALHP